MLVYDNIEVDKMTPEEFDAAASGHSLPEYAAVVLDDHTPAVLPPPRPPVATPVPLTPPSADVPAPPASPPPDPFEPAAGGLMPPKPVEPPEDRPAPPNPLEPADAAALPPGPPAVPGEALAPPDPLDPPLPADGLEPLPPHATLRMTSAIDTRVIALPLSPIAAWRWERAWRAMSRKRELVARSFETQVENWDRWTWRPPGLQWAGRRARRRRGSMRGER